MISRVEEIHSKAGFSGTSSTLWGLSVLVLVWLLSRPRTRVVQKVGKAIFFFASRGKLNNSCFLAGAKSHLQRKNSRADEGWRMRSPPEHCRALGREEQQQPRQMHKGLHGLGWGISGLWPPTVHWRLGTDWVCAMY